MAMRSLVVASAASGGGAPARASAKKSAHSALTATTDAERILRTFRDFDDNKDGTIDAGEFSTVLKTANPEFFTDAVIDVLFQAADDNKDGRVCYTEFVSFLFCEDWATELVGRVREELGVREVVPVMQGCQLWLDATMIGSLHLKDDRYVERWADLSSSENDAVKIGADSTSPTFLAPDGLINGMPGVRFKGASVLWRSKSCKCKTVVLVAKHIGSIDGNISMLFSEAMDKDLSIRVGHGGDGYGGDYNENDFANAWEGGRMRLNGVEGATWPDEQWQGFPNAPVVIVAIKPETSSFMYQLSSRFMNRGFDGVLGEVIIYDRELDNDEIERVEVYLKSKWLTKDHFSAAKRKALESEGKVQDSHAAAAPKRSATSGGKARQVCKYRAGCHTTDAKHRSRFSHPGDDDYQKPLCKHGATCYRSDAPHLDAYSHPDDGERRPCPYSLGCFRTQADHLKKFVHPGDPDYFDKVRTFGGKAIFLTMMQCFRYCDPEDRGLINDKGKVGEMLVHLDLSLTDDSWERLEDGKGLCYFPEFVEWANAQGINLPLGLEDAESSTADLECGFIGCPCKIFKASAKTAGFCTCKHKKALHVPCTSAEDVPNPLYWTATDLEETGSSWVDCKALTSHMQRLVDNSVKKTWTRDRGPENKVPDGYVVTNVFRNENPRLWRKYAMKKAMLKKDHAESGESIPGMTTKTSIDWSTSDDSDPVDPSINEWYLWHGTSQEGAEAICKIDFKVRLAGTATGTLYGKGTYFAESITKADEYAKEGDANPELGLGPGLHCVLLCRIIGGNVRYTDEVTPDAEELQNSCLFGNYDSVVGDREKCRGTFKEFVIFSADQAYPEYIVYFTRVYN